MTCRLEGQEGIPISPDGGHCDHREDGVGDDLYDLYDDSVHLFIILRFCSQHDKILSASHTVTSIVETVFSSHTQGVVNTLELWRSYFAGRPKYSL